MARLTQRARIEAVAGIIRDRMAQDATYSLENAQAQNTRDGWTFTPPGQAGLYVATLTDWELMEAWHLAVKAVYLDDRLTWTDPRKTGRRPIYEEPLSGILLELPPTLIDAIEAARSETTRREWIETAIRQRLEPSDLSYWRAEAVQRITAAAALQVYEGQMTQAAFDRLRPELTRAQVEHDDETLKARLHEYCPDGEHLARYPTEE